MDGGINTAEGVTAGTGLVVNELIGASGAFAAERVDAAMESVEAADSEWREVGVALAKAVDEVSRALKMLESEDDVVGGPES